MKTTLYASDPASAADIATGRVGSPAQISADTARAILGAALILGVAGDSLLRDPPIGLAFGLWIGPVAVTAVSLLWRAGRSVSRETTAWLAAAVVFSFGIAWRNSDILVFLDFCATIGCLGMAAVSSSDARAALFARRLRDTMMAGAAVIRGVIAGILPLAFRDLARPVDATRLAGRTRPVVRAVVISAVLALVFGALLRSADPIFASLIAIPHLDFDSILSHVLLTVFFGWVVAGWARAAIVDRSQIRHMPAELPFRLGMLDVTASLGTLNVLFGAFVLAQLGWFFGGEQFLRERTGLTAAAYARQGFFQLVWVVALVVPVLVATRAALRPERAVARRHTLLALPIIGLLGAIVVSAALRMKLYVHFYGLTTDRLYPLVFMAWLAVVLGWLALTVLRDWGRPFFAGAAVSGLAALALLNVWDPDAFVARVDIERAASAPSTARPSLDLAYLAGLSGRAVEMATDATLSSAPVVPTLGLPAVDDTPRCAAARTLLRRWGPASKTRARMDADAAWRRWNADDAAAMRAVGARFNQLLSVEHTACSAARQTPR